MSHVLTQIHMQPDLKVEVERFNDFAIIKLKIEGGQVQVFISDAEQVLALAFALEEVLDHLKTRERIQVG